MSRRLTAVCAGLRSRHEPVEAPEVVLNGQDIDSAEARFGGISADGSRRRYRPQAGCSADARPPPRTPAELRSEHRRLRPVRLRPVTNRPAHAQRQAGSEPVVLSDRSEGDRGRGRVCW